MNDIHKRGGTILGTSRGGHETTKIVDSIQDRGINQARDSLYLISKESSRSQGTLLPFISFTSTAFGL